VAFRGRTNIPGGDIGYTRPGNDYLAGGSGSGMGTRMQGTGALGQGIGSIASLGGAWEPSIPYLFALAIAEMVVFHVIGRMLK
jgi:hypothetical protein